jgi:hypothetical protein
MKPLTFIFICLLGWTVTASAADSFTVKYVSAENVYVDGGASDGLSVGSRLMISGPSGITAELEVVFVAAHSASCRIIGPRAEIKAGDKARLTSAPSNPPPPSDSALATIDTTAPVPKTPDRPRQRTPSRLSGNFSIGYLQWNDASAPDLDFAQTTTRLSLKARRLWDRDISLTIRGRGRLDRRERDYRSAVTQEDWQNRLWEFSLCYDAPRAPVHFHAGRILPKRAGSVGYLDGILTETRLSDKFRLGVFAGSSPDWLYQTRYQSLFKTGGYITLVSGRHPGFHLEENVGAAGEYHHREVSRELLFVQGRLSQGRTWEISHAGEVEVNRSWRREKTGKPLELSNLFINGWVRPSPQVRFSLTYDSRTNFRTFDTRSVVDSLFDDHLRQGVRLQTDLALPARMSTSASAGYRKRTGDPDPSWSYSAHLRKSDLLFTGMNLSAQYAGFDNPTNYGYNYSLRTDYSMAGRYSCGAGYGRYAYRSEGLPDIRTNDWIELSGQGEIGRNWWLSLHLENDFGDDIDGLRIQSELGFRF